MGGPTGRAQIHGEFTTRHLLPHAIYSRIESDTIPRADLHTSIYSRIESDTIPRADLHTSIHSIVQSDAIFRADLHTSIYSIVQSDAIFPADLHTSIYSIVQSDAIFRADLSYLVSVPASVCQVLTNAALGNDIVRLKHEKAAAERQIQDAREVADAVSLTIRKSITFSPSPPFPLFSQYIFVCFFD
jgi:hypothetical protein